MPGLVVFAATLSSCPLRWTRWGRGLPVLPSAWAAQVSGALAREEYGFRGSRRCASASGRTERTACVPRSRRTGSRWCRGPATPRPSAGAWLRRRAPGALRAIAAARSPSGRARRNPARRPDRVVRHRAARAEHGVTLGRSRPAGDAPYELEFQLGGMLGTVAGPTAIGLRDAAGRPVLSYAGLLVARRARPGGSGALPPCTGTLAIEIDDRGAAWPLTVDPLLTAASWSADGGQAGARLGSVVAAAGDVNGDGFSDILVGAPLYDTGVAMRGARCCSTARRPVPRRLRRGPWTAWSRRAARRGAGLGRRRQRGRLRRRRDRRAVPRRHADGRGARPGWYGSAPGPGASPDWTGRRRRGRRPVGPRAGRAGDVDGDGDAELLVAAPLYDAGAPDGGRSRCSPARRPACRRARETASTGARRGRSSGRAGRGRGRHGATVRRLLVGSRSTTPPTSDEGQAALYLRLGVGLAAAPAWTEEGTGRGPLRAALALAATSTATARGGRG